MCTSPLISIYIFINKNGETSPISTTLKEVFFSSLDFKDPTFSFLRYILSFPRRRKTLAFSIVSLFPTLLFFNLYFQPLIMLSPVRNLEIDVEGSRAANPQPAPTVDCAQSGDRFDPHYRSCLSKDSLNGLRTLCRVPPEVELVLLHPDESSEMICPGYCCAYEIYFKGYGLFLPITHVFQRPCH